MLPVHTGKVQGAEANEFQDTCHGDPHAGRVYIVVYFLVLAFYMKQVPQEIQDWILQHGKRYNPVGLPKWATSGAVGDCFDVSILNAMQHKQMNIKYVEGFARNPLTGKWIYHAWISFGNFAYDPTWVRIIDGEKYAVKTEYIGIEMDTHSVAEFMMETGYKGVLANAWRSMGHALNCVADCALPIHSEMYGDR